NPLTLIGVTNGTNTSTDSLLTISAGVVKKLPVSTFLSSSNYNAWSLGGNNITSLQNFGTTSNFDVPFIANNTEVMRITSGGNIGIGVTNPGSKLQVTAPTGVNPLALIGVTEGTNTSTDSVLTISSGIVKKLPASTFLTSTVYNAWNLGGNSVTSIQNIGTTSNYALPFVTNNTEKMRITEAGNVGIGTTAPAQKLDVNGNVRFTGALMPNGNAGVLSNILVSSGPGVAPSWQDAGNYIAGNAWMQNGNNFTAIKTFGTTSNFDVPFITNNIERMRLTKTGFFGIGTASPAALLHISGINPLMLNGVQNGTVTTADSLLTINNGTVQKLPVSSFATPANAWNTLGNSGTNSGSNFLGTSDLISLRFRTNNVERMVIDSLGRVGIGVNNPANPLVVKDTFEIRRVGSLSQLLFSNTANSGDFRIGGDGGDIFWQGGGGRSLQMGSYWTTILTGDRQTATFPAFRSGITGTSVLIQSARDASVPLGVQANSTTQTANLTEWRNSAGNILSVVDRTGNIGIGLTAPTSKLHVFAPAGTNPLTLIGVTNGTNTLTDSVLTISAGIVKKLPVSTFLSSTSYNAWNLGGNAVSSLQNLGTTTNYDLPFITNGIEAMRITTSNNVGIGTTTPTAKLDVNGNFRLSGAFMPNNSAGTAGYILQSNGANTAPTWVARVNGWNLGGNSVTSLQTLGTTTNYDLSIITNGTEAMRITTNNNVGINKTAPTEKLDVTGNFRLSGAFMPNNNAGTTGYILQSNGANAAPTWVAAPNTGWALGGNSVSSVQTLGTTTNFDLPFITNNTEEMRLTKDGWLGIGTATPSGTFHVLVDNSELGDDYFFEDYGSTTTQGLYLRKARGTKAAPANLQSGDLISYFRFTPRINNAFPFSNNAGLASYYKGTGTTDREDLRFYTSSNEQMRIDEDGNVGIGTSSFDLSNPEKLLIDAGNTSSYNLIMAEGSINNYLQFNIQNNNSGSTASSDVVATANNGTETSGFIDMGINSSGFTNTTYPIISGASTTYLYGTGNDMVIGNATSGKSLRFFTSGFANENERMRIDATGNVSIGTTTSRAKLTVDGSIAPLVNGSYNLGTSSYKWSQVYALNGTINTSDRRTKKNIHQLKYGLKEILSLQPVSYNWKDPSHKEDKIGLIAQDVKKVVPEVVVGDESKEMLGLNYAELVPVLINAIKEQQKQIEELKEQVNELKNKK
ncbi:MAG: tail fiber domain-containing protein, partial [Ilyomonas sp.]